MRKPSSDPVSNGALQVIAITKGVGMDCEQETPIYLNHRLWELYRMDCNNKGLKPSVKDFLLWIDEEGYEL